MSLVETRAMVEELSTHYNRSDAEGVENAERLTRSITKRLRSRLQRAKRGVCAVCGNAGVEGRCDMYQEPTLENIQAETRRLENAVCVPETNTNGDAVTERLYEAWRTAIHISDSLERLINSRFDQETKQRFTETAEKLHLPVPRRADHAN